jgi:hypothetical protein
MEDSESVFVPIKTRYFSHKIPQLQKQTLFTAQCFDPVPSNKATLSFRVPPIQEQTTLTVKRNDSAPP